MSFLVCAVRRSGEVDVLAVLDKESCERITKQDPYEIVWPELPQQFKHRKPHTIRFVQADEADYFKIADLVMKGQPEEAIKYACRGIPLETSNITITDT